MSGWRGWGSEGMALVENSRGGSESSFSLLDERVLYLATHPTCGRDKFNALPINIVTYYFHLALLNFRAGTAQNPFKVFSNYSSIHSNFKTLPSLDPSLLCPFIV